MEEEFVISFGKSKKPINFKQVISEKSNDSDKSDIKKINITGNILSYSGYDLDVFTDKDNELWWKAVNVTKLLNYATASSDTIIRNFVSECNKIEYGKLVGSNPKKFLGLKIGKNDAKSKYINTAGILELLGKSKKKKAEPFKTWLYCEVLPAINKNGKYEIYKDKKDFEIVPNDEYQDWGLTNNSSEIKGKRVIYLGAIGVIKSLGSDIETDVKEGEMLFKYGETYRENERRKEHIASMDLYTCFYVAKCMRNEDLEKDLEYEFKRRRLIRKLKMGNNNHTELFVTSSNFTIEDIKKYIENWIEKNDYKLSANELELAQEKTKQEEAKIRQLELLNEILKNDNVTHMKDVILRLFPQENQISATKK